MSVCSWLHSLKGWSLRDSRGGSIHIAHYGCVTECERLAADLVEQIDAMVVLAQQLHGQADRHQRLVQALGDLYAHRASAHGTPWTTPEVLNLLAGDIALNASGLDVWLDRKSRRAP